MAADAASPPPGEHGCAAQATPAPAAAAANAHLPSLGSPPPLALRHAHTIVRLGFEKVRRAQRHYAARRAARTLAWQSIFSLRVSGDAAARHAAIKANGKAQLATLWLAPPTSRCLRFNAPPPSARHAAFTSVVACSEEVGHAMSVLLVSLIVR